MRSLLVLLSLAMTAAACASGAPAATPTQAPGPASTPSGSPSPAPQPTGTDAPSQQPTWTELAGETPPAREDHTWTADGDGAFTYLFGGRAGSKALADLWRYDLRSDAWMQLTPAGDGPAARFGHAAVWSEGIGLVVWAGQVGSAFFDDLWAYDPAANTWRLLPAGGAVPAPRYGSCAVERDGRIWISHGFTDAGRFSDTRAYEFATGTWTDLTPGGEVPVERCLHDCLWAPDGRLLLYAGQTTGVPALGDLWAFDTAGRTWERLAKPEPPARQLYAVGVIGDVAWVFGGADVDRRELDDLWALDLGQLTWRSVTITGPGPVGRSGATFVADPARGRLLLFGGRTDEGALHDLWQLALAGR
jgi:hypothetical protein